MTDPLLPTQTVVLRPARDLPTGAVYDDGPTRRFEKHVVRTGSVFGLPRAPRWASTPMWASAVAVVAGGALKLLQMMF